MAQNQNTDPLVDHLYNKYYKDKLSKEEIAGRVYGSEEAYNGGLRAFYNDIYKGKVESFDQMKSLYQNKYGNPFASKKKVESELPSQGGSESLAPDPQTQQQVPQQDQMAQQGPVQQPVNPFQDTAPLSLTQQQVGQTLEQDSISLDPQPIIGGSTASKIKEAREQRGFGERLLDAGKYGLSKVVTMTSKIPGYIDEINLGGKAMEAMNMIRIENRLIRDLKEGKLSPDQVTEARKKAYEKNPFITNNLKDGILDAVEKNALVKYLDRFEEDYEQWNAENSKSISRHLSEGNYGAAGAQTLVSVVESLPVTLAAMFGGPAGLAGITLGTAAEKEEQLAVENPDMDEFTRIINATLTGMAEGGTELVTAGIGAKTIKAFVAEEGEEAVKKAVAKTFKDRVGNTLKKVGGKTYVEEGLSEAANSFAQNLIDRYTGADPDRDLMEGVIDAAIVGGVSGKLVGGLAQDVAKASNRIKQGRADKKSDQIIEKSKDLTKQIIRRREKLDDSVLPAADQLVEYAAENGITDMTDAWEQFLNEQTEDMKESLIREGNGDDIIRIAETKAVVNESIQDTEETQQDEATAGQTEAESQTQEEVQEQQVEEEVDEQAPQGVEQPTEEEVTAEPVEEEKAVDDASQQEAQVEPELADTEPNVEVDLRDKEATSPSSVIDQEIKRIEKKYGRNVLPAWVKGAKDSLDFGSEKEIYEYFKEKVSRYIEGQSMKDFEAEGELFTSLEEIFMDRAFPPDRKDSDMISEQPVDEEQAVDDASQQEAPIEDTEAPNYDIDPEDQLTDEEYDQWVESSREEMMANNATQQESQVEPELADTEPNVEEAEPTVEQEQVATTEPDVKKPTNTQELVNEIKEKGDPVQKELASMVETLGAVDNIETTNENLGQVDSRKGLGKAETSGRYGSKIAKVALDDQAIEEFADEHGLDAGELRQHAATHEMTHAITMQAIHASRKIRDQRKKGMSFKEIAKDMSKQTGANITEGDVKAIATLEDDIDALRVKVSNELAKGNISLPTEDDRMGLRGTMDFIAETFSNPKFRSELAKVKVLDKVIDAIKKFIKKFGGDKLLKAAGAKKGTALESAIEQGFRAMDFYAKLNAEKFNTSGSVNEVVIGPSNNIYTQGGSGAQITTSIPVDNLEIRKTNPKYDTEFRDILFKDIEENGQPHEKAFLKVFKKLGADKYVSFSKDNLDSRGKYNWYNIVDKHGKIRIDSYVYNKGSKGVVREVVVHEMVHAVTVKSIEISDTVDRLIKKNNGNIRKAVNEFNKLNTGSKLNANDLKAIQTLNGNIKKLLNIARNNSSKIRYTANSPRTNIKYGLTNEIEFIAEAFSSPSFMIGLQKMEYSDNNKSDKSDKSVFKKLIESIASFFKNFGFDNLYKSIDPTKGSVLEAAIEQGFRAMELYDRLNRHKVDAVNKIKESNNILEDQKPEVIRSYMALSGKRPLKIINTEKYVAKKINQIPDHQIVENVVDAFGVSETDAIQIIEDISGRQFRPNMNTIVAAGRAETAKIFFWVRSQIKKIGRRKKSDDDTSPYLSAFDELVRLNIQDKWIGLKRYQESIQKLYGENIDDELNAYILREQANSVTADYEMRTFEKILGKKAGEIGYRKAMKGGLLYQALKDGVTWGDMNEFLYMRHAIDFNNRVDDRRAKNYQRAQDKLVDLNNELANIDKNASPTAYKDIQNRIKEVDRLAKKYQPLSVPASGVTNQEAEQRLREIRRDNPQVEVHADRIRSYLFGEYISNLREYKLLSDERIDALENGTAKDSDVVFKNYVPLKVKSEKFESEFEMDSPGLGSIYDFGLFKLEGSEKNFGPEDRHDALSVMMTLAVKSKRTGEINNSLRAYAGLIKQYGSQEATVVDGMVINKTNSLGDVIPGSVRDFSGKVANAKAKITYINEKGKHSYIIFKSEQNPTYLGLKHFPKRYSKMGGTIQQAAAKVNNVRRALITQWNPKFAFSNMIRDTQDAFFNTLSEQQLKNGKIKFVKNLAKAHKYMNIDRVFNMSGSGVNISNDPTLKTFQDAWINMQIHGGAMSWGKYTHSFEEEVADIDKRVAEIEKGLSGGKKARAAAMNALNRLAAFSDGIENATRLAAYVTAMEMGASPQSAAAVSRDISLNFQRKGLYTSNLNLWYLFLNAGIQGAERGLRSVRKFGWGKSFTLLTGLAFANRMMMHELFAGDDEEKKKQVEALIYDPYVSANKSIFAAPWMDKPVMFNKPYSFMRVFFGLGEGIADLVYEYKTPLDIASDLGANVLTAIDPIGGSTGSLTAFVPSEVLRLGAQVGFNEQWNGSPILYSMAAEDNTLNKNMYSKNTNKSWVAAAEILYDNTGADWIAPAYMEYIMDKEINVGVLKEGAGMIDEFVKAYGGEEGKRLTEMAEQLMINIAKLKDENGELLEVESKKFNKYRAYPTVKLFYSPRDPEKVMLGNFINILYKGASFANTPAGGLSTGEMNYLKEGYDLVRREELLNPSMLSRRMNNMIEKFPDEDWGWYDSAKSYWD